MGPQGEEIVEATSLAARLGSAIVDVEVRRGEHPYHLIHVHSFDLDRACWLGID